MQFRSVKVYCIWKINDHLLNEVALQTQKAGYKNKMAGQLNSRYQQLVILESLFRVRLEPAGGSVIYKISVKSFENASDNSKPKAYEDYPKSRRKR